MKRIICITFIVLLSLFTSVVVLAHSGLTDANGGHRDNNNVSGLGPYHYHHGYPAHLHPNRVCPYAATSGDEGNYYMDLTAPAQNPNNPAAPSDSSNDFNIRLYDRDLENLLSRLGDHKGYQFPASLPDYDEYVAREKDASGVLGLSPQDVIGNFTAQNLSDFMTIGFEHGFSVGYLMSGIDSSINYERMIMESQQNAKKCEQLSTTIDNKELIISDLSRQLEQVNNDYARLYNRLQSLFILISVLVGILIYLCFWYFYIHKKTLASERSSAEFREEKLFQHLAEIHRGAINPYTDTPIETAADYKQYWKEYEEDRQKSNPSPVADQPNSESGGNTTEDSLKGTPFNSYLDMQLNLQHGEYRPIFSRYSRSFLNNAASLYKKNSRFLMFVPYISSFILLSILIFLFNLSPLYLCFFLLSIIIPIFYREGILSLFIFFILAIVSISLSLPMWISAILIAIMGAMIGVKIWWAHIRKILTSAILSNVDMLKSLFEGNALSLMDKNGNLVMRHMGNIS